MAKQKDAINLTDSDLFGNDIAEDEEDSIFESYAYEAPEIDKLIDPSLGIQVIKAYKGEGKSALLRIAKNKLVSKKDVLLLEYPVDHQVIGGFRPVPKYLDQAVRGVLILV